MSSSCRSCLVRLTVPVSPIAALNREMVSHVPYVHMSRVLSTCHVLCVPT